MNLYKSVGSLRSISLGKNPFASSRVSGVRPVFSPLIAVVVEDVDGIRVKSSFSNTVCVIS